MPPVSRCDVNYTANLNGRGNASGSRRSFFPHHARAAVRSRQSGVALLISSAEPSEAGRLQSRNIKARPHYEPTWAGGDALPPLTPCRSKNGISYNLGLPVYRDDGLRRRGPRLEYCGPAKIN